MKLIEISESGAPDEPVKVHPLLDSVVSSAAELYRDVGFERPWISYLAVESGRPIGTCAFKSPPVDGRVEIAYFTFPDNEGRGVATWMAKRLVDMAHRHDPAVRVIAQTLPAESASTAILRKIGFSRDRSVEHPEDGTVWEWSIRPP